MTKKTKTVGDITFTVGTTFCINKDGILYRAEVIDLHFNSFFFKTDIPEDYEVPRVAPFSVVPFYVQKGVWSKFEHVETEVPKPTVSSFISYLHHVKGMTPLEIHAMYPGFAKGHCYSVCAECKTFPNRRDKAVKQVEKYIEKFNKLPYDRDYKRQSESVPNRKRRKQ